ncbi:MAG: mechanosensitive ion channel protein MscS, partial [Acidocella sp. 20-61-6]
GHFWHWIMSWMPHWIIGLIILALAGGIAASLCRWVIRQIYRYCARFGTVPQMLISRCEGPSCAMIVLMVLGAVVPLAPFAYGLAVLIGHILIACAVIVLGWSLINTMDLFADLYLQRVRMDVEDNLQARKHVTQLNILRGALRTLIILLTIAIALMTSSAVRQYGVSLFASAGAAGLVVGLAARPLLSNLLAGLQIAMTQPIRLEDAVVVDNEWGWIESIRSTYVVIRIWDLRRLIVPLSYFIEKPFQNWTYQGADLLGTVMLNVDYSVPIDRVREQLTAMVKDSPLWDGKVAGVQMTDLPGTMVQLRLMVSARGTGPLFNLRCNVREGIVKWLMENYPESLPRGRTEVFGGPLVTQLPELSERHLHDAPPDAGTEPSVPARRSA